VEVEGTGCDGPVLFRFGIRSFSHWADRWGWTIPKVARFFKLLKKCKKIDMMTVAKMTRLTVCSFDTYAISRNDDVHDDVHRDDKMATSSRQVSNKERRKECFKRS